jgi:energy-coupling factor transport system permease protein
MIRDITLGQYYPTQSKIHSLDPRTKLVATLVFIISLFVMNNAAGIVLATVFLAIVIHTSNVPFAFMVRGIKPIVILMVVTGIFNLLFTPGDYLFQVGIIHVSWQGIRATVFMMVRLFYLVIGASVMTLSTTPNRLTDGMEKLMQPLNRIHVPVHEIAMMMSIALRFIPILIEETDKIMKAQMARGADFESGNLIQKAKSLVPVFVPLIVSAFRRANDLAMAMEARCYQGGEGRTKMKPLEYGTLDHNTFAILAVYLLLMGVLAKYATVAVGSFRF